MPKPGSYYKIKDKYILKYRLSKQVYDVHVMDVMGGYVEFVIEAPSPVGSYKCKEDEFDIYFELNRNRPPSPQVMVSLGDLTRFKAFREYELGFI